MSLLTANELAERLAVSYAAVVRGGRATRLTPEQRAEIRRSDKSVGELAEAFGVNREWIRQLRSTRTTTEGEPNGD